MAGDACRGVFPAWIWRSETLSPWAMCSTVPPDGYQDWKHHAVVMDRATYDDMTSSIAGMIEAGKTGDPFKNIEAYAVLRDAFELLKGKP